MLDFRHETFLTLCRHGSYAKTAAALHITQPAVSQHIKYLEQLYGVTLIAEKGRRFSLTPEGKELLLFIQACGNGVTALRERMGEGASPRPQRLMVGATRSVGEGFLPEIIAALLRLHGEYEFHLTIENTNVLLEQIQNGGLHFALIEGYFDSSSYESILFSDEEFIAVCSPENSLAKSELTFPDLLTQRQIIREKGSGSREIYEELLHENHLSLSAFPRLLEVNNLSAIKKLVSRDAGVAFLYRFCAEEELRSGALCRMRIQSLSARRKIHFVYPKNSLMGMDYAFWFRALLRQYQSVAKPTP